MKYYPNEVEHLTRKQFIHTLVNHYYFKESVATKIANQLDDKKIYICTNDFQGGEFGVGREENQLDWCVSALEWGDNDEMWDDYNAKLFYKIFNKKTLINWIQEMWGIEIKPIEEISEEELKELRECY